MSASGRNRVDELLGKVFEIAPAPEDGDPPVRFRVTAYQPDQWPRGAFFTVVVLNRIPTTQPIALLMFEAALRGGSVREIPEVA
jgi:hypothetical protein